MLLGDLFKWFHFIFSNGFTVRESENERKQKVSLERTV